MTGRERDVRELTRAEQTALLSAKTGCALTRYRKIYSPENKLWQIPLLDRSRTRH